MREKRGKPRVHGCKVHHIIFCPCRMCNVNVGVDVVVVVQKYQGKHTRPPKRMNTEGITRHAIHVSVTVYYDIPNTHANFDTQYTLTSKYKDRVLS